MEIEKTLTVAAPPQRVWALLLDPQVMGGCVPGMKSIDVVSDVEYVALMHVKIAFINAKFRLRTTIVEQRAPSYLRAEGTGEDASVASSLKQQSEIFLTPTAEGGTELRIKVNVDVLGRLGTFGLSVMKTKADRMWEEFGANLAARIDGGAVPAAPAPAPKAAPATARKPAPQVVHEAASAVAPVLSDCGRPVDAARPHVAATRTTSTHEREREREPEAGWWSRLLGVRNGRSANGMTTDRSIRIEIRQRDKTIHIEWPLEGADQCKDWLRELLAK
ncbi:Carbon monoxide dehydrogenase subunit G [Variovorax sp. HW608]|uniref:CoxG family protein n=1 Tax=Variovorax sp. HW608 TaxID=1034889 RepID=UPI00081F7CB9|nr:SRPBCC family protein [Variovorax sp. HW608]SCK52225.1 Carbon monoxide dehydrogenase subunit G [Variovorax sp. HW608]